MKKNLPVLICLFLSLLVSAQGLVQSNITAAQKEINKGHDKSIVILKKLENEIVKSGDFESFTEFGMFVWRNFKTTNDYNGASTYFNYILKQYNGKLSSKVISDIEIQKLWILLYTDQYDFLVSRVDTLIDTANLPYQKGWLSYFRGQGNNENGDYEGASSDYMQSVRYFDETNHQEGLSYAYSGLGDIQRNLGFIEKSKEYYDTALSYAKKAGIIAAEINTLSLKGITHSKATEYQQAMECYKRAYDLSLADVDHYNTARSLNNMGNVYVLMGEFGKALKANQASLEICLAKKMDYGVIANYLNLYRLNISQNNYNEALNNLGKATEFIADKSFPAERVEVKKGYSLVYEGLGDHKRALHHYKEYDELRKKLVSEKTQKAVKELQIKYETEIKDRQIEKMNYDLTLKKSLNKVLLLGLGLVISIGGFSIFFLVYRNRTLRKLYDKNIESLHTSPFIHKSIDQSDPLRKIFDNVLELLENEKIYRRSTMSLADLAELVGSNEKYVSNAISKFSDSNYSNFINLYRVNEAKRLLFENPDTNINDLMKNCGFNSRTPFYNAFIRFTGLSPKQFKEMSSQS